MSLEINGTKSLNELYGIDKKKDQIDPNESSDDKTSQQAAISEADPQIAADLMANSPRIQEILQQTGELPLTKPENDDDKTKKGI